MQIKAQLGKLKLNDSLQNLIQSQQAANDIQLLPIELAHVLVLDTIPLHHKDPFDRLLIAQSITEGVTLVSTDSQFSVYLIALLS